ncbi:rRNA maturation RNase YbeY [bacterium]|jgi:probable rRNA maturation factor|nr:rRNA maturation RNase YbeY [bacterium]MBT4648844.1 rRNA maturation RNase YbeY [bacterium]
MVNNFSLSINKKGEGVDFSWLSGLEKIIATRFSVNSVISIALINEDEIKQLNKVYRKKDAVTDVLSFNIDSPEILGEIVICLSRAKEQAKQRKKTLKAELQLLTVHGILHLLGYDHELGDKQTVIQERMEQEILCLLANKNRSAKGRVNK